MKEIKEILELIDELETYLRYRRKLVLDVRQVEKDYQRKYYTYFEYENKLKHILKEKTLDEWIDYYNAYTLNLVERIKFLNTQIFYKTYHDKRIEEKIRAIEAKSITMERKIQKPQLPLAEKLKLWPKKEKKEIEKPKTVEIEKPKTAEIQKPKITEIQKPSIGPKPEKARFWPKLGKKEKLEPEKLPEVKKPQPLPELKYAEIQEEPKVQVVEQEPMPTKPILAKVIKKGTVSEKKEIDALKKIVEKPSPVKIEAGLKKKAELFEKRASEKPSEIEYFTTYTPSAFGTLANRYFRGIGDLVIKKYPDSFESLFKQMRNANMKILSKTYVNIILLITSLTFAASYLVFVLLGFFSLSFYTIIIRPLVVSVFASFAAFGIAYVYPYVKSSQRSKTIDANLPFAINHMSAVATSGLPPDMMFRIVARSKEYSEVSVELRKLVEYIDLFGYDVTTAIQSISGTTPARSFKEFLDGALATLTSGGDFPLFLREKSDQAMFAYKLRMEKYNETISTYSDIYMGIMIVAPVFFIAILSLVSILGGQILGMDIQTLIIIGTYALIPFLNVGFLTFLEVSQPAE